MTPVSREGAVDLGFAAARDFDGPDIAAGAALRPDGRIVVAASVGYGVGVAQLTASGGLDGAFGAGGRTAISFGDANAARAVALQADGKIVVAGIPVKPRRKMVLARLLGDPPPATPSGGPARRWCRAAAAARRRSSAPPAATCCAARGAPT